jgi:hypothetical protein
MARPTTLNPLAVAFGAALRMLRKGRSISEVAFAAGVSPTFFRLIEGGRNHIAVSKVPALHAAFEKKVSYEALVFILSSIAALEDWAAEIKNSKLRGERLREGATTIGAALRGDHPFHVFLKKFAAPFETFGMPVPEGLTPASNIFEAVVLDPASLREIIAKARLGEECRDLLSAYDGYSAGTLQISQDYSAQFFSNIPSLYKEFFDGLKSSVLVFPRFFAPESSWEWEKKNYDTFEQLFVVCYWSQLVDVKNLTRYKFDYLWRTKFGRAVFVLLDDVPGLDPRTLKDAFWENLTLGLEERANDKAGNSEERQEAQKLLTTYNTQKESLQNKTLFLPCPRGAANDEVQSLLKKFSHEDLSANAMWFFRTSDKAFIGAASHINPKSVKASHIMFLTFSECSTALAMLNKIFPSLL